MFVPSSVSAQSNETRYEIGLSYGFDASAVLLIHNRLGVTYKRVFSLFLTILYGFSKKKHIFAV